MITARLTRAGHGISSLDLSPTRLGAFAPAQSLLKPALLAAEIFGGFGDGVIERIHAATMAQRGRSAQERGGAWPRPASQVLGASPRRASRWRNRAMAGSDSTTIQALPTT